MTEAEWVAATDPRGLLQGVAGRGKARRLRLCAVACCRLVAHLLPDRCRRTIEVAEAYADKRVTSQQLAQAGVEIRQAQVDETMSHDVGAGLICGGAARVFAIEAVCYAVSTTSRTFAEIAVSRVASALGFSQLPPDVPTDSVGAEYNRVHDACLRAQMPIVRDVVSNPFLPLPLVPDSLPASVLSVAKAGYDERLPSYDLDPLRLSVLADALEDAGCTADTLLGHLRSAGLHVRGCWALDLILGKE
jgi:hypothetical protein